MKEIKDIKGVEIEVGDKVVFSVGTALKTGVVLRTRLRTGHYGGSSIVRVKLDVPEPRGAKHTWQQVNSHWVKVPVNPVDVPAPRTEREVYGCTSRLLVLDTPIQ